MAVSVLIIDDDNSLLDMYRFKFEIEGFRVYTAQDGETGLEKLIEAYPDIVLLDIMLPGESGFSILGKVREKIYENRLSTKVIMFSNINGVNYISKGYDLGFDGYIVKGDTTPKGVVQKIMDILNVEKEKTHTNADIENRYQIYTGKDNSVLRKKSREVQYIDDDVVKFSEDLMNLMWLYDGVGLAAPQIGRNIRVLAVTEWDVDENGVKKLKNGEVMVNPRVYNKSSEKEIDYESCLSLPDVIGKVSRPKSITVSYLDIKGEKKTKDLEGFSARIICHEVDHLDGILFSDRIEE